MGRRLALTSLVLLNALVGCLGSNNAVVQVGSRKITQSDIEQRQKQQRFENQSPDVPAEVALIQLAKAFLGAEILKKNGRPVETETIKAEAERIDKSTLMPDRLAETKKLFKSTEDYLRLYVLPVYVNRVLYFDFFLRSPQIHSASLDKAQAFKKEYESGPKNRTRWEQLAKDNNLLNRRLKITRDRIIPIQKGPLPPGLMNVARDESKIPSNVRAAIQKNSDSAESETSKLIREVISKLSIGQATPVLEYQDHFTIMRIAAKKSATEYEVDSISFRKRDFQEWLNSEAKAHNLKCLERSLCHGWLEAFYHEG